MNISDVKEVLPNTPEYDRCRPLAKKYLEKLFDVFEYPEITKEALIDITTRNWNRSQAWLSQKTYQ